MSLIGMEKSAYFCDEIIMNILSRLPVKSVMRSRIVCRRWNDLTLSPYFIESHLRNSCIIPTILVSKFAFHCGLDLWLRVHGFPFCSGNIPYSCRLLFSHDGLLVLLEDVIEGSKKRNLIILNPARSSHEHVKITLYEEVRRSKVFGVYFHPLLKEYCSLWKIEEDLVNIEEGLTKRRIEYKRIEYKVLNLGSGSNSNLSLKTISNPFITRVEKDSAAPLFVNNHLYWLLNPELGYEEESGGGRNDIMVFHIITEELTVVPCPIPLNTETECMDYQTSYLLNIDGILSFILVSPTGITIWRLKDHAQMLWTSAEYTLSIDLDFFHGSFPPSIAVVDGKLALVSNVMLIFCNLIDGTVEQNKHRKVVAYFDRVLFLSHQMSLASLGNCKRDISICHQDNQVIEVTGEG